MNQFLPGEVPEDCPDCGKPYRDTKIQQNSHCADCNEQFHIYRTAKPQPPKHTLFALEYHCDCCKKREGRRGRFFKGADEDDHRRFAAAKAKFEKSQSKFWPTDPIPPGDETNRLLRWGYRKFSDLHNERQLVGLATLAREIRRAPASVRPALATVYSDFIRYQNMICRYDTGALKILDVFSIHGFPVHRVQCEAALVGVPRVGSGGFRHFLAKYAAAKRYCQEPFEMVWDNPGESPNGKPRKKTKIFMEDEHIAATFTSRVSGLRKRRAALLRSTSISSQKLPPETVDMVLTDPPYFANVQYSELMDFLYAWLRRLVPETDYFREETSRSKREVTGNVTGGVGINDFAEGLSQVYRAATGALKPGGPFAFTYHHNDLLSYAALVVAVLDSGLVPICTYTCHSEMRGSIHINSNQASHVDTVFVFRKPPVINPGDETVPVEKRFAEHVANLENAHLSVSSGDRTCIWHGLVTEEAIRSLKEDWDAGLPIEVRMRKASEALTRVNDELDRTAEFLPVGA